jgi:phospholipid/cholesterol/gamma-HCH transport system substrate-binding protein
MSQKNKDVFSEMIVGVFMVAILALLAYFTIVISGVDLLAGRAKTAVNIAFPDVGGLKERDNVMYRGMKVGTVERIALRSGDIVVTAQVDRDVVLRESARVSVAALSLLGGNYLLLEEGAGAPQPLDTTLFRGERPVDWMRDLGEIARNLNTLSADGSLKGLVTNLEATARNLNRVMARVERGEGTVGRLLSSDETLYRDLTNAVADARATFAHAAAVSARLEKGEGTIGRLLSADDTVYGDLKTTMANAAEVSRRLVAGEGVAGRLLRPDDALWGDVTNTVANLRVATDRLRAGKGLLGRMMEDRELADNAAGLVADLKTVAGRLARGEGTLGKMTAESELYDEINALVKDIRQIVDNYRDTTPITTFGSLVTGGL